MTYDIKGFKLATGQEIIAEVVHAGGPGGRLMTVRTPLVLRVTSGPKGFICDFFPWTIVAAGDIKLNRDLVVAEYEVPKDVQEAYLKNTTGLEIVGSTAQLLHS